MSIIGNIINLFTGSNFYGVSMSRDFAVVAKVNNDRLRDLEIFSNYGSKAFDLYPWRQHVTFCGDFRKEAQEHLSSVDSFGYCSDEMSSGKGKAFSKSTLALILSATNEEDFGFNEIRGLVVGDKSCRLAMCLHYWKALGIDERGRKTFTNATDRVEPMYAYCLALAASGFMERRNQQEADLRRAALEAEVLAKEEQARIAKLGGLVNFWHGDTGQIKPLTLAAAKSLEEIGAGHIV